MSKPKQGSKLQFQVISDLHLETLHENSEPTEIFIVGSNLCLLGDIGYPGTSIYTNFIQWCSEQFVNVFVIFGNHEYWNENIPHTVEYTKSFPQNVYFLNNSCVIIGS